jgi:CRP-like cAMP-binding protein
MQQDVLQLLRKVLLFSSFDDRNLKTLLKTTRERGFAAGTPIMREGDQTNLGFYLILDGQVEVRKGETTITKLGSGQFFGEMALFDEQTRSADVVPLVDTKCVVLTHWDFKALVRTYPEIALTLLREPSQRLRKTDQALGP